MAEMACALIEGPAFLLGDDINTDLNCSGKYLPGKDESYIAAQAFEAGERDGGITHVEQSSSNSAIRQQKCVRNTHDRGRVGDADRAITDRGCSAYPPD